MQTKESQDKKIVIATLEPDGKYRYVLNRNLNTKKVQRIIQCSTGQELIDKITDNVELIIASTDLQDGGSIEEVIKALRQRGFRDHIILYSSSDYYKENYKRIGANGFVNKFSDNVKLELLLELNKCL